MLNSRKPQAIGFQSQPPVEGLITSKSGSTDEHGVMTDVVPYEFDR